MDYFELFWIVLLDYFGGLSESNVCVAIILYFFNDFGFFLNILDNFGLFLILWTILDYLGICWILLDYSGLFCIYNFG